jgi:hypothetical protein
MTDAPSRPVLRWIKQLWPWLVGAGILVVVATRIPLAAFRDALQHGPHLLLATVTLATIAAVLCTDAVSTWIGLIALQMHRPLGRVVAVRGATYLLFLLNWAVGQGGFGYYLFRSGTPALRATGATLFLMGTNLATLLLLTTGAFAIYGVDSDRTLWWTLVIGCVAFAGYLGVIALAPAALARRELLAPLFDAGLRGHALAIAGRVPHVSFMVLGQWVAMRAWGIPVPFGPAMVIMPIVVLVSALPISPAGFGTTQAALVYFFRDYAAGGTAAERESAVLAFALVHFVYGIAASLVVGFACAPFARRVDVVTPPAAT